METRFKKNFTQQEAIPEDGIKRALELMKSGRLHRYNVLPDELSEASQLEVEYAKWQESKYCLACSSGGIAIQLALRSLGVKTGDKVLANAFTLAPVPGAIENLGAIPILVEIDKNYHIDIDDLKLKAEESGSQFLLLSHMRGHISDMDKLMSVCKNYNIKLIEDCAHTMGAKWRGVRSGNFGKVAAFSTQTYKHINSGEGGFVTTDDEEIAAKCIIHSGSYMLYDRHQSSPSREIFEKIKLKTANFSGRLDNLRASILRSQLPLIEKNSERWNDLYKQLSSNLNDVEGIEIPKRRQEEFFVGSSIQFRVEKLNQNSIPKFIKNCFKRGVELKWFGDKNPIAYTSRYDSWKYIKSIPRLPKTINVLSTTLDMRIPLTFNKEDCNIIAKIIIEELKKIET